MLKYRILKFYSCHLLMSMARNLYEWLKADMEIRNYEAVSIQLEKQVNNYVPPNTDMGNIHRLILTKLWLLLSHLLCHLTFILNLVNLCLQFSQLYFISSYQLRKLTLEELHLIQHKFYWNLIQAETLAIPGDEIKNSNS